MKEVILCKYGEVVLKGANKPWFENLLLGELRRRAGCVGRFDIYSMQSTVFIEPLDDDADIGAMMEEVRHTFGFAAVCRAAVAEKNIEDIKRAAIQYLPRQLDGCATFKVESRRSDKLFPMKSPEISAVVGEAVLSAVPHLKVKLMCPDIIVKAEVRERAAYLHAGQEKGAGGLPPGSNGCGLLLLSGGIDSPVAGYMMAKRGVAVEAVHFESFPYTSERAREKVLDLARILCMYCGSMNVHIISLTRIQEKLHEVCEADYFTLLLRRFMMSLAQRTAQDCGARSLITGESLGQVASQTMQAIAVTDCVADMPVFRPCIGMDKEEIVCIARRIGTYETSILPYEDCCTVFTPPHPRTKPVLWKVEAQESKVDFAALAEEAWQTREIVCVKR